MNIIRTIIDILLGGLLVACTLYNIQHFLESVHLRNKHTLKIHNYTMVPVIAAAFAALALILFHIDFF